MRGFDRPRAHHAVDLELLLLLEHAELVVVELAVNDERVLRQLVELVDLDRMVFVVLLGALLLLGLGSDDRLGL